MSMYHVIQVIPEEKGGGAEIIVQALSEELLRLGISCERVHFTGPQAHTSNVTRFGLQYNSCLNIFKLRKLINNRLKKINCPIIVHTHLTHAFFAAQIALMGLDVVWLHTEHTTTMKLREIKAFRPLESMLYQRCDKIIAISVGVQDAINTTLRLPPERVTLINNGARNFALADRPPLGARPLRLISIGTLESRKGFDIALAALAKAKIGDWHYTILGQGREKYELIELTRQFGISDRVTFAGWFDSPEMFLAESDLQLIPSRWEGFGLVAVEGLSTGLRIIASDVLGLRDVLGPDSQICRMVHDHLNPNAWATSLEAEVAELRQRSSPTEPRSAMRAAHFSFALMTQQHDALYRSLLRNGRQIDSC